MATEHVTQEHLDAKLEEFGKDLVKKVGAVVSKAPASQCVHHSGLEARLAEGERQRSTLFEQEKETADAVIKLKESFEKDLATTSGIIKTHLSNHRLAWAIGIGAPAAIITAATVLYYVGKGMGHW